VTKMRMSGGNGKAGGKPVTRKPAKPGKTGAKPENRGRKTGDRKPEKTGDRQLVFRKTGDRQLVFRKTGDRQLVFLALPQATSRSSPTVETVGYPQSSLRDSIFSSRRHRRRHASPVGTTEGSPPVHWWEWNEGMSNWRDKSRRGEPRNRRETGKPETQKPEKPGTANNVGAGPRACPWAATGGRPYRNARNLIPLGTRN